MAHATLLDGWPTSEIRCPIQVNTDGFAAHWHMASNSSLPRGRCPGPWLSRTMMVLHPAPLDPNGDGGDYLQLNSRAFKKRFFLKCVERLQDEGHGAPNASFWLASQERYKVTTHDPLSSPTSLTP